MYYSRTDIILITKIKYFLFDFKLKKRTMDLSKPEVWPLYVSTGMVFVFTQENLKSFWKKNGEKI